jgi:hypothetical protein
MEEAEHKIGFARAGGAQKEDGVGTGGAGPGDAGGVQAHDQQNVASFGQKRKGLLAGVGMFTDLFIFGERSDAETAPVSGVCRGIGGSVSLCFAGLRGFRGK